MAGTGQGDGDHNQCQFFSSSEKADISLLEQNEGQILYFVNQSSQPDQPNQIQLFRSAVVQKCSQCDAPGKLGCAGCNKVQYCSVKHLQEDWAGHRVDCCPMTRVDENPESKTKYLQATMDIKYGDIIIFETGYFYFADPGVGFGDKLCDDVDSYSYLQSCPPNPVCVGCFNGINSSCSNRLHCPKCNAPICMEACAEIESHVDFECRVLKYLYESDGEGLDELLIDSPFSEQVYYDFVAVMRILLIKRLDTKSWRMFERIMFPPNDDQIRRGKNCGTTQNQERIQCFTKLFERLSILNTSTKNLSETVDLCFQILNVLKRRGFAHGPGSGSYQRCLSAKVPYIEHSCLPNVDVCVSISGEIIVKALKPILKGEKILASFVNLFRPTYDRRLLLQMHRYTDCDCRRCSDQTEMGTYFGSLKCYNKMGGCGGQGYFLVDNPENLGCFNKTLKWKCESCGFQTTHNYITDRAHKMAKAVVQGTNEEQRDVRFLAETHTLLKDNSHECHFVTFHALRKLAYIFAYTADGYIETNSLTAEVFGKKISMCDHVSIVMGKFGIEFSPYNAETIYELMNAYLKMLEDSENSEHDKHIYASLVTSLACQLWNAANHCDPQTPLGDYVTSAESLIDVYKLDPSTCLGKKVLHIFNVTEIDEGNLKNEIQ